MLCRKPFTGGTVPFACGQCLPCRIARRRKWMWRQFFEGLSHEENSFVTLTLSDVHLREHGPSVVPLVLSKWVRSLRKAIYPAKVRYFGVGEYGDENWRPHYHLSLFGYGEATDQTVRRYVGGKERVVGGFVHDTWGRGFVEVVPFNEVTAQYVAGYTVKKMTAKDDPRLAGLHPEFPRMSNRPGLGLAYIQAVARELVANDHGMALLEDVGDVPRFVYVGSKQVLLDRYLLQKLREAVGFTDEWIKKIRDSLSHEKSIEVQALLKAALDDAFAKTGKSSPVTSTTVYKEGVEGRLRKLESRHNNFRSKRNL